MSRNKADKILSHPTVADRRHEIRLKRALKEAEMALHNAILENDQLVRENEFLVGLSEERKVREWSRPKRIVKGESTAILLLSDWHVEQTIRAGEVNGLGGWNQDIAVRAIRDVFRRTVEIMLPRYRIATKIDELVVWLGGDFIEGDTRDEAKQFNSMPPLRAAQFAKAYLKEGLKYLADSAKVKRIVVVTSTGNHDRMTQKLYATGRNDTSYATLVYDDLREGFYGNKKIVWHPSEGQFTYLDVYDHKCRFFHGDAFKYQGGIGGLSVPANKAIDRWDSSGIKCHASFFGHWHNFHWNFPNRWVCNGCLPGVAPYSLGYAVTKPCQAFAVIDKKRGLTDATRIYCR